ncbi:MAG: hypothetical protein QOE61_4116 [Micromonosporaceae bacterium]|jgi:hypothetical protein|nr:hypothetical protein [Micromonosporaceae bacterium]
MIDLPAAALFGGFGGRPRPSSANGYVVEVASGSLGFHGADGEHVRDAVSRRLADPVDA